ncbi:MAG: DUF1003 domain-containing protein [archaeon]
MDDESLVTCHVTKQKKRLSEVVPGAMIRPGIVDAIRKNHPDFSHDSFISRDVLKGYRQEYIESMLKTEKGELTEIDKEVVKSMVEHEILVKKQEDDLKKQSSFGQKVSDKFASIGGSWAFVCSFMGVLVIWVVFNSVRFFTHFDPAPFILLNLVLSCIAAIQAPIIMMSQNRQEARVRLRSENDYKTDLKAELEIRHLHEKIDHLTRVQWQRLLEIQQMQLDLMEEMAHENRQSSKNPAVVFRKPRPAKRKR